MSQADVASSDSYSRLKTLKIYLFRHDSEKMRFFSQNCLNRSGLLRVDSHTWISRSPKIIADHVQSKWSYEQINFSEILTYIQMRA